MVLLLLVWLPLLQIAPLLPLPLPLPLLLLPPPPAGQLAMPLPLPLPPMPPRGLPERRVCSKPEG